MNISERLMVIGGNPDNCEGCIALESSKKSFDCGVQGRPIDEIDTCAIGPLARYPDTERDLGQFVGEARARMNKSREMIEGQESIIEGE